MPIGFYALPEVVKDIDLINNNPSRNITFYVIKEDEKKVIYACCNPKPFAHNDLYFDSDILIISMVSDDGMEIVV